MKQLVRLTAAALVLCGAWGPLHAATTYSNLPENSSVQPFGFENTATYGQTFLAPLVDNVLDDFTFRLAIPDGIHMEFKGMVFAWSGPLVGFGGSATGAAVFASSTQIYDGTGSGFINILITTGGVALVPGAQYVAVLTISDGSDYTNTTGTAVAGTVGISGDPAAGSGGFAFYNNGSSLAQLTDGSPWDNFIGGSMAWEANFSSPTPPVEGVPEPASLAIWGLGFVACVAGYRRRKVA